MEALIEEAAKKAAVAWVRVGAGPAHLVWTAWVDGALHVVTGGTEQAVPGLVEAGSAEIALRGDHGGRILTCPVTVTAVEPAGPDWGTVAPQVAAKRLNGDGGTDEVVARWATGSALLRLDPAGEPVPPPDGSLAEPVRPTPATRLPRKPFRLHKVRRGTA